jgi:hypothetical protein
MHPTQPMIAPLQAEQRSTDEADTASTDETSWEGLVEALLRRAAAVAGDHGAGLDQFMNAAYGVFLDTHPELRARLAEARMLAELEGLRSAGLIGSA